MPVVTPVLWKYRPNKRGLCPIYLRVSDGDKTRYRSLRLYVRESQWSEGAGRVNGRHPNAAEINRAISNEAARAEGEVYRRAAGGERADAEAVAASLDVRADADGPGDFYAFADEFVAGYRARGQMWTHDRYLSVLKKMRAYTGEPFPFERLTPAFLRRYESHLASAYGNSTNTIATNLATLKTVVRRAVAEGHASAAHNPFALHVIRTEPTAPVRLTLGEVKRFAALDLGPGPLAVARDAFLVQFFGGGARFSDVLWLRWSSVGADAIGYTASKTKKAVEVPLVPQAAEVLGRYRPEGGADPAAFVLPLLAGRPLDTPEDRKRAVRSCTTMVNRDLKVVASQAGIAKNLTTHVARHSFADHCRTMGLSVYDISKAMRHSSLKQTERYLSRLDTGSLGQKMSGLFD